MMSFFVTSEDLTQTYKMTSSDVQSVEKLTSFSTHCNKPTRQLTGCGLKFNFHQSKVSEIIYFK